MSRYATNSAVDAARSLGIDPRQSDFRNAFLTITETVAGLAETARFIGPTRTAERWAVSLAGTLVEVIYEPSTATITRVERAREARSAA